MRIHFRMNLNLFSSLYSGIVIYEGHGAPLKVSSKMDKQINRLVNIILENDLECILTRDGILNMVNGMPRKDAIEVLTAQAELAFDNAQEVVYGE